MESLAPNPQTGFQQIRIWLPDQDRSSTPLEMVQVPSGQFEMGTPRDEYGRWSNEFETHTVILTKPFWASKYEVTQEQWRALVGRELELLDNRGKGPNHPVYNVNWWDIQEFLDKMNALGFGTFRLPTEAEWEYFCRAGTSGQFWFGDVLAPGRSPDDLFPLLDPFLWYQQNGLSKTHPAGEKSANPWGIHDLHGNVSEYCNDYFQSTSSLGVLTDPQGPKYGDPPKYSHVIRDGNYDMPPEYCRSGMRGYFFLTNNERSKFVGFRIVRDVEVAVEDWAVY